MHDDFLFIHEFPSHHDENLKISQEQENMSPVFQQRLQTTELLRIQLCPKRATPAGLIKHMLNFGHT